VYRSCTLWCVHKHNTHTLMGAKLMLLFNYNLNSFSFLPFGPQTNNLGYRCFRRQHGHTCSTCTLMVVNVIVWLYNYFLDSFNFLHFGPQTNHLGYRFFRWQPVHTHNTLRRVEIFQIEYFVTFWPDFTVNIYWLQIYIVKNI
jgi:hypothetical protein